ncbi:type II methionyl aminopeptidase [Candidatus Bathyarchaeota archaeon]|nr:type II methionyl aminopeptidase [Candidatus Bathyarchaeota archaeon]MBS7613100.1 type II methionyl aminopeptidase [Candidatus Bathyarchaeota archaeon]MBS7617198.1 type II methionyl aminopeptidase [Candidatus Bathyarchaeota archaeon]
MDIFEPYFKAGEIARKTRAFATSLIKSGVSVLDLCEKIEGFIKSQGGEPAFPCNICINEVAAHYTAEYMDSLRIPEQSIVKMDLGVHIDGFIVDTAITVALDEKYMLLKEAAEEALRKALKSIRASVSVYDIGETISKVASTYNLKPIRNLSGHEIARYNLHAGISIPNIPLQGGKFKLYGVYAVEPFITEHWASGTVIESTKPVIYRCLSYKKIRDTEANVLLKTLWSRFKGLPFAERWIHNMNLKCNVQNAWFKLKNSNLIKSYRPLVEISKGSVAQAEETILVVEDGVIELTGFPL